MRASALAPVLLLALGSTALAQLAPANPDWKEAEAPAPPPVTTQSLIPVDLGGSELRWGVDPASISVGPDGIVRYVVVATSGSGTVNAFYEGLRCANAEVKVYARYAAGDGWTQARDPQWRPLSASAVRHSKEIARGGACQGRSANQPASRIAGELRSGRSWHEPR